MQHNRTIGESIDLSMNGNDMSFQARKVNMINMMIYYL